MRWRRFACGSMVRNRGRLCFAGRGTTGVTDLSRLRGETSTVIVDEALDEAGFVARAPVLKDAEVLIDAVVGTGFKPPLRGLAALLREMVEGLDTPMVAVDLP